MVDVSSSTASCPLFATLYLQPGMYRSNTRVNTFWLMLLSSTINTLTASSLAVTPAATTDPRFALSLSFCSFSLRSFSIRSFSLSRSFSRSLSAFFSRSSLSRCSVNEDTTPISSPALPCMNNSISLLKSLICCSSELGIPRIKGSDGDGEGGVTVVVGVVVAGVVVDVVVDVVVSSGIGEATTTRLDNIRALARAFATLSARSRSRCLSFSCSACRWRSFSISFSLNFLISSLTWSRYSLLLPLR